MNIDKICSCLLETSNQEIRNNLIITTLENIEMCLNNNEKDTKKLIFYQQFCIYILDKFNYTTPILQIINSKLGSNYSSIQHNNINSIIKNIEELPFWIDKKHIINYIKELEKDVFLNSLESIETIDINNENNIENTNNDIKTQDYHIETTNNKLKENDEIVSTNNQVIPQIDHQLKEKGDENVSTNNQVTSQVDHQLKKRENVYTNNQVTSPKFTDEENKFKEIFKETIQLEIKIHDRSLLNKLTTKDYLLLNQKLEYIKSLPQPDQRSTAWYEYRNNMLTASDLYDAVLGSISDRNRIAVNKCNPVSRSKSGGSVACNWGIRYEDIAIMVYETRNKCNVEDYGCIQHPDLSVFGASPDGIISNTNKDMIGRMLEIKCPYSRVINGKPSKKYYSQIQGQLEVCDLEYCDFLECKFKEYTSLELLMENRNQDSNEWGVIIGSYHKELDKKIDVILPRLNMSIDEVNQWIDLEQDKIIADDNLEYVGIYFWELDVYSCILIKRDRELFQKIRPRIIDFWNLVEYHRENGIENIKSTPKNKTTKNKNDIPSGFICSLDD